MEIINEEWDKLLSQEFNQPYFAELLDKVEAAYSSTTVYPPKECIYEALRQVSYNDIKVVIIGQDPYHGKGQANGMAFAVNNGIKAPPSLRNIFKEVEADIGKAPSCTTLKGWAKQGVLLLNATLTVSEKEPNAHSKFGWQRFTDKIVSLCSVREKPMVFILWGANAHQKTSLINSRHFILQSPHPCPFSAYKGFFGCKHFSKANEFLTSVGVSPIDWTKSDDIT